MSINPATGLRLALDFYKNSLTHLKSFVVIGTLCEKPRFYGETGASGAPSGSLWHPGGRENHMQGHVRPYEGPGVYQLLRYVILWLCSGISLKLSGSLDDIFILCLHDVFTSMMKMSYSLLRWSSWVKYFLTVEVQYEASWSGEYQCFTSEWNMFGARIDERSSYSGKPPWPGFKLKISRLRAQHSTVELFCYPVNIWTLK